MEVLMCPVCVANAVLTVGSAASSGGLAALAIRALRTKTKVITNRVKIAAGKEKRAWLHR
jgi:hypothetical protein